MKRGSLTRARHASSASPGENGFPDVGRGAETCVAAGVELIEERLQSFTGFD